MSHQATEEPPTRTWPPSDGAAQQATALRLLSCTHGSDSSSPLHVPSRRHPTLEMRATPPLLSPTRYSSTPAAGCIDALTQGESNGGGSRPGLSVPAGLRRRPAAGLGVRRAAAAAAHGHGSRRTRGCGGTRSWGSGCAWRRRRLWDVCSLSEPFAVLKGRNDAIRGLRFSLDGRFLAAAEAADFVHVYDAAAGYVGSEQVVELFGEVAGAVFSPEGR